MSEFKPIEVDLVPDETFVPREVDFTPPAPPTPKPAKSATPKGI